MTEPRFPDRPDHPDLSWELQAIINTDDARKDCAFCHRERTLADDNHAPGCPYWDFFVPREAGNPEEQP
jgi:hypothetical protein